MPVHTHATQGTSSDIGEPVPAVATPAGVKASDGTLQLLQTDADGNLLVMSAGSALPASVVSVGNSTTTPLAGTQTFTGVFEQVLGYSAVIILAISDAQAVTNEIFFDWSTNGTDIDYTVTANYRINTLGYAWRFPVAGQYFRLRWTTQQTQTYFRLQTIYQINEDTDQILTNVEDLKPFAVTVIGADAGGQGPGIGIQVPRLETGAKSDSPGNGIYGLVTTARPGVLDTTQFLQNESGFMPIGGTFYDTITPLSDQLGGVVRATANRAIHTNLRDSSGVELGGGTGSPVWTQPHSSTGTTSQVSATGVSKTILASNANRRGAAIENDASPTLYVKLGTTASVTDYTVQIVQNAYYEVPFGYTGEIDGIWASSGSGAARITELT